MFAMRGWVSRVWVVLALAVTIMPSTAPARADAPPGHAMAEASIVTGHQLWVSHYDGPGRRWDFARAVAVSPDGTKIFSTGKSWDATSRQKGCGCGPSRYDYATVAYGAATGRELWIRRYNGPGNDLDDPANIVVGPGGRRVFITGSSAGPTGVDFATLAYQTSTGRLAWARRYNGPGSLSDEAQSVDVSPDGSAVFVAGPSGGGYVTVAYDAATGSTFWVGRYNTPDKHTDRANDLVVSPDGTKVFVTGYTWDSFTDIDAITIAYDAATGDLLWATRRDSGADTWDVPSSIDVGPDGERVFVTGRVSPGAGAAASDYMTIAYDAGTGTELWVSSYQGTGSGRNEAESLDVSPDGAMVFVTGSTQVTTRNANYATVAYDTTTGAELWATRYNGPGDGNDLARAGASSPDGSMVFVTGYSRGAPTSPDYATVAYDAHTGVELWVELYDGPAHGRDRAKSLAVSPQGTKLLVLGFRESLKGYVDFATVAYSI
jgi:hypothetical protein